MKENLDEITHISEDEVRAIRSYKLQEIHKAWNDLFAIGIVPILYGRHPEYIDYKSFEQGFRERFETTCGNTQIVSAKIDYEIQKIGSDGKVVIGIKLRGIGEDEMDLFKNELLSLEYSPPKDWKDIAQHLLILVSYYSNGNIYIPSIEMRADLSLCKLIGAVNRLYGAAMIKGETRVAGRKRQVKNLESSQAEILAAYQYLGINDKPRYTSKLRIAKDIRDYFVAENDKLLEEEKKKIPSIRTIIRHMESIDEIHSNLIGKGLIKDKPNLV